MTHDLHSVFLSGISHDAWLLLDVYSRADFTVSVSDQRNSDDPKTYEVPITIFIV